VNRESEIGTPNHVLATTEVEGGSGCLPRAERCQEPIHRRTRFGNLPLESVPDTDRATTDLLLNINRTPAGRRRLGWASPTNNQHPLRLRHA
jgi:hypothetical protein